MFHITISSIWCRGKSAELSSATQHAMPPEFGLLIQREQNKILKVLNKLDYQHKIL